MYAYIKGAQCNKVVPGQPLELNFTFYNAIIGLTAYVGVGICDVTKPVSGTQHCTVISGAAGAVGIFIYKCT